MRNKILMTLALLLTAVTGAWAGEEPQLLTTITFDANGPVYSESGIVTLSSTGSGISSAGIYYILPSNPAETMVATVDVATGKDVSKVVFYGYNGDDFVYPLEDTEAPYVCYANAGGGVRSLSSDLSNSVGSHRIGKIEVYGHAEPALTVEWDPATKTGNFVMPAYDVELTPIYAPTAMFATDGNLVLTPTAIEGVYAESTDAIVTAGTVAKIGETENPQGTVMYAVTSTNQATAPALDAFSADVPTAESITVAGDVLVWYYIKGADTPTGEKATAENTFNDSEICPEPITVTLLSNKFDIQFKAANDNTIEAGKATVKVGDEAAEVKEGKLTGVKMNSKVTVTAKDGYKFRKVEVKKGIAPAYTLLDNTMTAWTAGKYAVPAGGLTYSAAITVSGDVTLVLTDGETLTLNKGISLAEGATLTIQGNGTMNVNGSDNSTASTVAGTGTLLLTSGTLSAKGGNGAGVGADSHADVSANAGGNAINGDVTVSGGTLTATGGNGGNAGVRSYMARTAAGGAAISGSVTISAGAVVATGGNAGTLSQNCMNAVSGAGGAAIAGNATLTGGSLTKTDGTGGGSQGGGTRGAAGKAVAGTVTNNGGTVNQ